MPLRPTRSGDPSDPDPRYFNISEDCPLDQLGIRRVIQSREVSRQIRTYTKGIRSEGGTVCQHHSCRRLEMQYHSKSGMEMTLHTKLLFHPSSSPFFNSPLAEFTCSRLKELKYPKSLVGKVMAIDEHWKEPTERK